MIPGLALQAAGYAWIATSTTGDGSYLPLGLAFAIAGIGTSFCFPTVANATMSAVPVAQVGIASGTNSALRQLGGVFGAALLASVFAAQATTTAAVASFTDSPQLSGRRSPCPLSVRS